MRNRCPKALIAVQFVFQAADDLLPVKATQLKMFIRAKNQDECPSGRQNYYRLGMVDNGGDITHSHAAKVTVAAPAVTCKNYTIPATDSRFTIEAGGLSGTPCLIKKTGYARLPRVPLAPTTATAYQQVVLPAQLAAGTCTVLLSAANRARRMDRKVLLEETR